MANVNYVTGQQLADVLDLTYADDTAGFDQVAGAVDDLLHELLSAESQHSHGDHYPEKEAALGIAVDLYQARTAAGGESVALDFTPGPYRVSSHILKRYSALLAPFMNVNGMVG